MMREESQEKTPVERTDIGVGYNFDEQSWLQLMCCTPVSGHDVGRVFWSRGKLLEKMS